MSNLSNAENILYHYIQKILLDDPTNPSGFVKELIEHLIIDLSIWLSPTVYEVMPVLAPFVVRDPKCRARNGSVEKWGSADTEGYLRDDNSLIKSIPNALMINSPLKIIYSGKKGSGFTACHIWRKLENQEKLASRYVKTNSFVPNLVWLPSIISELTDREGSYAQNLLKTISYKIYRNRMVSSKINVNEIWDELNDPMLELPSYFNIDCLNYFMADKKWIDRRKNLLNKEIKDIISLIKGEEIKNKKIKCSRYTLTLPSVLKEMEANKKDQFKEWLLSNL